MNLKMGWFRGPPNRPDLPEGTVIEDHNEYYDQCFFTHADLADCHFWCELVPEYIVKNGRWEKRLA